MSMPPPPQGSNQPYGQPAHPGQPGQPPYGYPNPGAGPYGQQPYPGGPGMPTPPPRRNRISQRAKVKAVIFGLTFLIGGIYVFMNRSDTPAPERTGTTNTDSSDTDTGNTDSADTMDVGDCMQNNGSESDPDLEMVDCADAAAEFKVKESHVANYTCAPGEAQYQQTRRGRAQFTLCLTRIDQ